MGNVSKIIYKGKEIIYVDYRGATSTEEMIALVHEAKRIIIEDNKKYLLLSDLRGVRGSKEYIDELKKAAQGTPKLAEKRAVIGIDSIARKVLLKAYNLVLGSRVYRPFNSEEEAKDWLVND